MSGTGNVRGLSQGEGTLSRAAQQVAEAKADLDRLSGALVGQLQALQQRWAGQGGQAFQGLVRAWDERYAAITRALDGFERSLLGTETDMLAADQEQGALMGRLAARLGG